jgi:hypothetical protein
MLFKALYPYNHNKYANTLCEQSAESLRFTAHDACIYLSVGKAAGA